MMKLIVVSIVVGQEGIVDAPTCLKMDIGDNVEVVGALFISIATSSASLCSPISISILIYDTVT